MQSLLVGLVVGFSFWDIGNSSSDLQMRILAIFQILILGMVYPTLYNRNIILTLFKRYYAYWCCYATILVHERIVQTWLFIKILFLNPIHCCHVCSRNSLSCYCCYSLYFLLLLVLWIRYWWWFWWILLLDFFCSFHCLLPFLWNVCRVCYLSLFYFFLFPLLVLTINCTVLHLLIWLWLWLSFPFLSVSSSCSLEFSAHRRKCLSFGR